MTEEEVKDYLCLYEEIYSWNKLSYITGKDINYLRYLYNELCDTKELLPRKKMLLTKFIQSGVYRINPLTGEVVFYKDSKEISDAGFYPSNVFHCCRCEDALCNGYLWRFGDTVGKEVFLSVKKQMPKYFRPIEGIAEDGTVCVKFDSVFHAVLIGGCRKETIVLALSNKDRKYRKYRWRFSDG